MRHFAVKLFSGGSSLINEAFFKFYIKVRITTEVIIEYRT